MAGLIKPQAAEILIHGLKEAVGLPIHLHTHAPHLFNHPCT